MIRGIAIVAALATITGCAIVETHAVANRAAGVESFVSVGDVVVRVDVREDLPNAFGRADVYGRTRDRGFAELRYMGLDERGAALFWRRDVDIVTNEDTFTRSGIGSAIVTQQPSGAGSVATVVSSNPSVANVQVLPPNTIAIVLDLNQGRTLTVRDASVEILAATSAGVRFVLH